MRGPFQHIYYIAHDASCYNSAGVELLQVSLDGTLGNRTHSARTHIRDQRAAYYYRLSVLLKGSQAESCGENIVCSAPIYRLYIYVYAG